MSTTPVPTDEQVARARWDLLLTDLEYRVEQLRQVKHEPGRLAIQAGAIFGLLFAAGAVFGVLAARVLR